MSNRLIVDACGQTAKQGSTVPKIAGVKPFGSTILVELLNPEEALGTSLHVGKTTETGAPQAYVLALGPKLPEEAGVKVGDRVMLQGTGYVPIPNYDKHTRNRGIIEIHHIKAVFVEVVE